MFIEDCRIISNIKECDSIYRMKIASTNMASTAKAGQFLHIKISDLYDPLLRRPLSICSIDDAKNNISILYKIVGKGTELLSKKNTGDMLNIIGPLGKGFPIFKGKRPAIIGGGIGIAPLLELSRQLDKPDIYLGFKNDVYLLDEFSSLAKSFYICTEDGSTGIRGFPTQVFLNNIKNYHIVYTCGPIAMIKAVKNICEENDIECYISMEENMGCGIGACLTCSCKNNKGGFKRVCIDGPVFNSKEVVFDD